MLLAVYVIRDPHLSMGTEKPMDIFEGWTDYTDRLRKNWIRLVKETDTVIIPGDISWGMTLDEALPDFVFLNSLPGRKIISKGNHDLWWPTMKKLEEFKNRHGLDTISFLFNNSYEVEDFIICGTRGWSFENGSPDDEKIILREAGRLRASLRYRESEKEKIVFLHYPPIYQNMVSEKIIDVMKEFGVRRCYYGHLHGRTINYAFNGVREGIKYKLISADSLEFCPYIIDY
jgi:predicted phosphohydrolase